ncbi:MAG: DegT/DnrJ/EryC1/StrS family aminotransferase [Deltaproteobacteria bacterium]|nr:DegT/DnrJ/EryC1/StrS family aminotransferase [Deltaproteobacteria bacterium]
MKVPLLDLKEQYSFIKNDVLRSINQVLEDGHYILGPHVEEFEEKISKYCGGYYALGVSSGTDALLLALLSIGIEPDDEVITTPFSFFATSEVISFLKAKPVFVDIDPKTYCLNPEKVERALSHKTKAIIPVHLFGQCADMDPLVDIAQKHNLHIIEDACQALGATYRNKQAGTFGAFSCFSFYPSKNLGTYCDAGLLLVKDYEYYLLARDYRSHGEYQKNFNHKRIGMNARMSALAASILNVKFKYLDEWNEKRREKAEVYNSLLCEYKLDQKLTLPFTHNKNTHIFHQYVILTQYKDKLRSFLESKDIQTGNFYPIPLPFLPCYKDFNFKKDDFPQAMETSQKSVALPLYPEITLEQQKYVVSHINDFFRYQI